MHVILIVIAAIVVMSAIGTLGTLGTMFPSIAGGVPVIVMILAIVVFGGVMKEYVRSKKDLNRTSRNDLNEIKQRISQIEADIADIKEQIADLIINQV